MHTYILVSFWLTLIGLILRAIIVSVSEYPRKEQISLGAELMRFIVNIPFMLWAAYLLWGL